MAKSQIEKAVEFLKERGWEFRPAEKIEGVFKPVSYTHLRAHET